MEHPSYIEGKRLKVQNTVGEASMSFRVQRKELILTLEMVLIRENGGLNQSRNERVGRSGQVSVCFECKVKRTWQPITPGRWKKEKNQG